MEARTGRLGGRLWRPERSDQCLLGLAIAVALPALAAAVVSELAVFDRFPELPYLLATLAATLVGRLSAGLLAVAVSAVLITVFDVPPLGRLDAASLADLVGVLAFSGLSLSFAYTLAAKDAIHDEAAVAGSRARDLARSLATERNAVRQMIRQMPNGVIVVDAAGALVLQNDRSRDILGYAFEEGGPVDTEDDGVPWAVRHPDGTVYPQADYPLARALAGEAVLGELMVLERHDGSTQTIEVDAAPIRAGDKADGAVTVFQDVTERIETRSRLARTTRRLEQTLAVTDAALSGLGFDDLAARLLRTVREVLETDSATLFVVDSSGAALVEHMSVGAETDGPSVAVPFGRGIAGTIAETVAPLVVDDVSQHEVVRPWLKRTTRSLVGAPLVYRGAVKGVIHVGSRTARHFTADEVEVLELAANRIASALERASLYDSRSAMSAALQASLLPSSLPLIDGLDLAALYLPFSPDDEIGGDFYDVFPHGDGSWGVVVGDVSGKGPLAAAIMGLAAHSVRVLARYESRPSEVLRSLNEILLQAEAVAAERFCTACEMRVRATSDHLRVTVCVAGHPLPLVVRSDGAIEQAGEPGTLLGAFADPRLHDVTLDLLPGDSLVAYTDGLVERRGADVEEGERRLAEVLRSCAGASAEELVHRIRRELIERVAIDDDVAVVVIRSR